ncbi:alpha/beta hydrolase domain-containing protein [Paracidovorax citrulli]
MQPPAAAKGGIQRLEILSTGPAFDGRQFGNAGAYEVIRAKAHGTIDPANALHAGMVFLDKVPRNGEGLVEYAAEVTIYRPADAAKNSGNVFYEMVNRGTNRSFATLNRGSETQVGNGFLMNQGYTIVYGAWQPEHPRSRTPQDVEFPVATNEGGAPIVAKVREILIPDAPKTNDVTTFDGNRFTTSLTYPPVNRDPSASGATLTVRQRYDDPRIPLPIGAVTFPDDRTVTIDMTPAQALGMDMGAIYEVIYDARDPYVGGMGFAATRDMVSFFKQKTADRAGTPNPVRPNGMALKSVVGWGNSQGGRILRDFVYHGFNQDIDGKAVFDGAIPAVAGSRRTDHFLAFAHTSVWIRQHEERDNPGAEFPFTYASSFDSRTGKTDGILAKCTVSSTCPKVIHEDSDLETWHGRISLLTTDADGRHLGVPDNVRLYQMSGGSHGAGNGTSSPLAICRWGSNPIDYSPVYRGLVVAMFQWLNDGTPPPASRYPNHQEETLVTLDQMAAMYPTIPGQPFSRKIATGQVFDFSTLPPTVSATYPIFVPKTDANGNPVGGVATPDLMAPLGTYSGRNYRIAGHAEGELCGTTGSFIPFTRTAAERAVNGDTRPSLEELYPGGEAEFRQKRRAATQALIDARFILPEELESVANQVPFPPAGAQ